MSDRATPIIVGIGEFKNPSKQCKDAIEPRSMMLKAINKAIKDVKLFSTVEEKLRADIDSIDVVETWSWSYPDLPGLLANDLKATVKHKAEYRSGGNAPTLALDEAARRIANKECQVAIVTGGEAIASRKANAIWANLSDPIQAKHARRSVKYPRLGGLRSIQRPPPSLPRRWCIRLVCV